MRDRTSVGHTLSQSPAEASTVLVVGRGLGLGGMERLIAAQLRVGDRTRFRYSVAYVRADKDDLVPEVEGLGMDVHLLSSKSVPWPVAAPTTHET